MYKTNNNTTQNHYQTKQNLQHGFDVGYTEVNNYGGSFPADLRELEKRSQGSILAEDPSDAILGPANAP